MFTEDEKFMTWLINVDATVSIRPSLCSVKECERSGNASWSKLIYEFGILSKILFCQNYK